MSDHDDARRQLLQAGGCFALAFVAAGLLPRELLAQPIQPITGTGSGEDRTYPIPAGDSVNIDKADQIILVRYQNHVFAFNLSCPHQNAAVRWVETAHRFQCTKHDSQYQPDGVYTSGRATRNMDRLPIRRNGASVVVNLDRMIQSDTDAAGWAAAVVIV
jgi:Rieske Fe-S protein